MARLDTVTPEEAYSRIYDRTAEPTAARQADGNPEPTFLRQDVGLGTVDRFRKCEGLALLCDWSGSKKRGNGNEARQRQLCL